MGQRAGKVTAEELIAVALPEATKTYTVISHQFLIDTTREKLKAKGFEIKHEIYKSNASGEVAAAQYRIEYGNDPDLGMLFSWANSYDKSMRFKCAVGGFVRASGASVISDTINDWTRKHTGDADDLTLQTIQDQVDAAEGFFQQLCQDKDDMKDLTMSKRRISELLGILYFELGVISGEQLGIIKKEYTTPRFTYTTPEDSLWTIYNHILVALAKSNPKQWMEQQRAVHMFVLDYAGIKSFDEETVEEQLESPANSTEDEQEETQDAVEATQVEVDDVDPNQVDLEDQIKAEGEGEASAAVDPEEKLREIVEDNLDKAIQKELPAAAAAVNGPYEDEGDEETAAAIAVSKEAIPSVWKEMDTPATRAAVNEVGESETFNMRKVDIEELLIGSGIGSTVDIEGVSHTIIDMTDVDYILAPSDSVAAGDAHREHIEKVSAAQNAMDAKVEEVAEPIMMSMEDVNSAFPGQGLGDIIEIEGAYFELTEVDGDDTCYALVAIEVDEAEEEEDKIDTEVPAGLGLPKQATQEEVDAKVTEKIPAGNDFDIDGAQEEMLEPTVMMSHEDIEIIPPAEDVADDLDPIRQNIQKELLEIYGEIREFEYEKKGDQYNITLGTNETMVMLASEVELV